MTDRKVVAVSDPDDEGIEIVLPRIEGSGSDSLNTDPFAKDAKALKEINNLSPAFKKKLSRDIQKSHTGEGGARSKKNEDIYGIGYFRLGVVVPPYNLDYLSKLYEISTPHKAAVDAKVNNIVGLGFDWIESPKTVDALQRVQGDEDKVSKARRKIERLKVELNEWLDHAHAEDTFTETLRKVWTDYEVTGNGYLEVGRKVNGQIGYIGHIPSPTVRVRGERDGFVQMIGRSAVFFRNFGDTKTTNPITEDRRPNEIIHFKKYTPNNSFYGVPDIMAAKNAVAGTEFASRFNLDYFEHKAVPRYIMVVKGAKLSENSERKLVDFFQTGLKGKNHRSLYIPLPADSDFEMKPVEAGTQDASFNSYLKMNRDEVLMAHRVPISKVGLAEGVSLAVARDADKTFKEQVCRPEQRVIEKKLNRLISEVTDVLRIKLNELTLTDEDTMSKIHERYLRAQVLVPNEVRRQMGLPGMPGGDTPVVLTAQAAAEQRAQAGNTRRRDQERENNSPDESGEARNPQGEGRQQQ